jgi:hypothetical protein
VVDKTLLSAWLECVVVNGGFSVSGVRVKIRACFLARIRAVCEPHLQTEILKTWQKVFKMPKNGSKLPCGRAFCVLNDPISTRKPPKHKFFP